MNKEVPRLRFSSFAGAWEHKRIAEMFDFLQNNTLSRADMSNDGEIKNIHYGDILMKFNDCINITTDDLPSITDPETALKYCASLLREGDVVIADTAEDETVGKCSEIICTAGEPVLAGLHTIAIRPKEKFARGFLGHYLNSESYRRQLRKLMQGIKVTSISKGALKTTQITYPTQADEQEKIGSFFSLIDNLINLQQKKCEKLLALKKAYLHKMFPQKDETKPQQRFAGFSGAWKSKKLSEISAITAGGDVDKSLLKKTGRFPVIANALSNDGIVGYYEDEYRVNAPAVTVTGRGDIGHAKARLLNFTPVVRLLTVS